MGNSSKASSALETSGGRGRKKKKGRPSLLEIQRRNLRLQQQEEEEVEESPKRKRRNSNSDPSNSENPYLKFSSGRRSTRRKANPNSGDQDEDEDEEEEDEHAGRKEKKLRLVLDAASDSPDNNDTRGKRVNSSTKATQGNPEPSSSGPTTPLPDKKLLVFILDRLQKKDTYGVFAEPVDPEELPDYHDIIENPMDFQTVRNKLDNSLYPNLEQFESDLFLICSNAMSYNSPNTIYYRQACKIQELAKKDFANLRQESEPSEPDPKPAPRRGRPPKNSKPPPAAERVANRDRTPTTDRAGPSSAAAGPSGSARAPLFGLDLLRGTPQSFPPTGDLVGNPFALSTLMQNVNNVDWLAQHQQQTGVERNDDFSGLGVKTGWIKGGTKLADIDDSRRSTYEFPLSYSSYEEPPILESFDSVPKILIPFGFPNEHVYARSLARFASELGPAGWRIAESRINQVLPPGVPFGPDWVGENDTLAPRAGPPPPANISPSPQPVAPLVAPVLAVPDPPPEQSVASTRTVVPKLNMHYQMNGCTSFNGFNLGLNLGGMNRGGGAGMDLNLGFQSPGQSSSSPRVVEQKQQPDLALQL